MKNKVGVGIVIIAVLAGVFNLIFFLTGGSGVSGVWLPYAFVHFAFVVLLVASVLYGGNSTSLVRNVNISVPSWIYAATVVLFNTALICIQKADAVNVCIVINAILLAIYIIVIVINLSVNAKIEENINTVDNNRKYISGLSEKIAIIMSMVTDAELRKEVEKVYDFIRTSPVMSSEAAKSHEDNVFMLTGELEKSVLTGDIARGRQLAGQMLIQAKLRNSVIHN